MVFSKKLENIIEENDSLLCIGLDPELEKVPRLFLSKANPIFEFNKSIIDNTHDLVCAYKPNIAFYEAYGIEGLKSLKETVEYIKSNFENIPIILDAKRGDIGNTAKMYAKATFDYWKADAVTVNPYLGFDSIEPFLAYKDKGIFILCRTSNPGAKDFQDTKVSLRLHIGGDTEATHRDIQEPLFIKIAEKIVEWNTKYGNCLMVIGGTYSQQMKEVRKIAPEIFFLVPGIGRQGGDLKEILKNGLTKDKSGLIINVSRSILYASFNKDFTKKSRTEAKKLKDLINKYRYD